MDRAIDFGGVCTTMYEYGTILQRPLSGRLGRLYQHVGIYIGRERVIHFSGLRPGDRKQAEIRVVSLETFAGGYPVSIRLTPRDKRHGRAIVRLARNLRHQLNNPYNHRYHFVFRNCEDFCRHCYRSTLATLTQDHLVPLPPSQRGQALIRLGRAAGLCYLGIRLGRLAGPCGMIAGAVAGGLVGLLMTPYRDMKPIETAPGESIPLLLHHLDNGTSPTANPK